MTGRSKSNDRDVMKYPPVGTCARPASRGLPQVALAAVLFTVSACGLGFGSEPERCLAGPLIPLSTEERKVAPGGSVTLRSKTAPCDDPASADTGRQTIWLDPDDVANETRLGEFQVPAEGPAEAVVTIPRSTRPGLAVLRVRGEDECDGPAAKCVFRDVEIIVTPADG